MSIPFPIQTEVLAIKGVVTCNDQKMEDVEIELYESGYTKHFEKYDNIVTKADGRFQLFGESSHRGIYEPMIKIYHSCNVQDNCYKKFELTVPQNYLFEVNSPSYYHNFGTIELSRRYPGEKLECL